MKHRRSDSRLHRGRRFDVAVIEDPRNYTYATPEERVPQSVFWNCAVRLDQGSEGACVGFGRAHGYACQPNVQLTTERIARFFYEGAKEHDNRPGEDYEGTTPNGLYRFLQKLGLIGNYYQIRNLFDLIAALQDSPIDLASPWRDGMFRPDAYGFIRYEGPLRGGHYLIVSGYNATEQYFTLVQSWGRDHGLDGIVKVAVSDMSQMIDEGALLFRVEEKDISGVKAAKPKRRRWWNPVTWF